MTNLLDLPLDQFRGYLAEGNHPQARQDELMRAYRAQNSLSGLLDRYGEEGLEGKNVSTFFPVAGPGGMSIFDALKSGQLQTRFKDYASDALGGVLGALENPKASYDGTLPQADYDSAAMGTGGLAMGGGGVVAGRNIGATNANASKSAGLLAASIDDQVKMAKQKFLENPDDKILFHEYQDLSRKRLEQKDQSAVLKAENRITESVPSDDVSYRGSHQPRGPDSEQPVRLDDISISTNGETAGFPSDFYGPNGAKYYAPGPRFAGDEYGISNQQSYRAIINAKNNPDAEVTMYRAVPNDDGITTINKGDFVTLSPKYAEIHGSEGYGPSGNDAGKVISQKVKVKDLYFAGDDVNEFGYFPNTNANASAPVGLLAAQPSTEDELRQYLMQRGLLQ